MPQSAETATVEYQLKVLQKKYDDLISGLKDYADNPQEAFAHLVERKNHFQHKCDVLKGQLKAHGKGQSKIDKRMRDLESENQRLRKEVDPLRTSVNSLTAERGKWIKKLRRAGVKV